MKLPKAGSPGEEGLALHLRAYGIPFEREACLVPGRKWRADFLLPGKIVVEVQGAIWRQGAHARGGGLERDYAKNNALTLAGYRVLQYSTAQVERGDAIRDILLMLNPDC